jgi:hypothetical protein
MSENLKFQQTFFSNSNNLNLTRAQTYLKPKQKYLLFPIEFFLISLTYICIVESLFEICYINLYM